MEEEAPAQREPSLMAPSWGYSMDKRPNSRRLPDPSLVGLAWGYNMDKRPNSRRLPDPSLQD